MIKKTNLGSISPNIIIYAPTHRNEGIKGLSELDFISGLDLNKINSKAEKGGVDFLIRVHNYHSGELIKRKIKKYKNIHLSHRAENVYDILPNVKCLISDYSSLYLDFLVYDRPVIHYCFDLDRYQKIDRGFYEPFEKNVAEPVFDNWNDVIKEAFSANDNFSKRREIMRREFIGHKFVNASSNLIDFFLTSSN